LTEFEFTESDAKITFRRIEEDIEIASTYRDGRTRIPRTEFQLAVNNAAAKLREEIIAHVPSMKESEAFNSILPVVRLGGG
jgi:hypothetical protein